MTFVADFEVGTADDTLLPRPAFDGLVLMQAGVAKLVHTDLDTHHSPTALELRLWRRCTLMARFRAIEIRRPDGTILT